MSSPSLRPVLGLTSCLALVLVGATWLLLRPPSGPSPGASGRRPASSLAPEPQRDFVRPDEAAAGSAATVDASSPRVPAPLVDVAPGDGAVIRGWVRDTLGTGVPAARVRIVRGPHAREVRTDELGGFEASDLPVGLYAVQLDPRSLPADLIVMPDGDPAARALSEPAELLRLTAGEARELELRVARVAQVSGVVVDGGGAPLVAAHVALAPSGGVGAVTRTDAAGRFTFARVRPGPCTLRVEPDAQLRLLPGNSPLPRRLEVMEGERLDLGRLVAGEGGHVLEGRVEDAGAMPLGGERVVCAQRDADGHHVLAWATTDERGRFRLGRVPSALLEVSVAAGDGPGSAAPSGLQLDTRGAAEQVDVGVLRVAREGTWRVSGAALVDAGWATANGFDPWRVEVQVRSLEVEPGPSLPGEAALLARFPEATSGFTWACATPHPALELRFVLHGLAGEQRSRSAVVEPRPGETERVEVRFP